MLHLYIPKARFVVSVSENIQLQYNINEKNMNFKRTNVKHVSSSLSLELAWAQFKQGKQSSFNETLKGCLFKNKI